MAKGYEPKKLLVEGQEDLRVIPELIEKNGIRWGDKKSEAIVVSIQDCKGYENMNADLISTELQASGLTHLGVIIDADEDLPARWISIRNACLPSIPEIPEEISEKGLLLTTNGIKFGVWIMPDNLMRGMLETFLAYMIRDESEPLWLYAQEVVAEAKNRGAPFIDSHIDKAYIYTWLAWQKPPGRQLHNAINEEILNPQHPKAQTFVTWFKTLYEL